MNRNMWLAGVCALGAMLAAPAFADDDRGRRYDRHEHRYDHRHEGRRDDSRYNRHDRAWRSDRRGARHVVHGRYCNDRRHYRGAHYHVPVRSYHAYGYPRHAYRVHGRSGIDATLIVTLPLF